MQPVTPWRWIPTLYFGQGLPYVVVMTLAVVMYKNLGVGNTEIALYTSWLYLPWVIKPLWSPLVDLLGSKRLWVLALQFGIGLAFACVALTLPGPGWLIVFGGLALLATEFEWAGRLLDFARRHVMAWTRWVGRQSLLVRGLIGLVGLAFVWGILWAYVALQGVPRWMPFY